MIRLPRRLVAFVAGAQEIAFDVASPMQLMRASADMGSMGLASFGLVGESLHALASTATPTSSAPRVPLNFFCVILLLSWCWPATARCIDKITAVAAETRVWLLGERRRSPGGERGARGGPAVGWTVPPAGAPGVMRPPAAGGAAPAARRSRRCRARVAARRRGASRRRAAAP